MGIVWCYFIWFLVGWFICNEQRCTWIIRLVDIEADVCTWAIRCNLMFCYSDMALDFGFGLWWLLRSCFMVVLCVSMISDCAGCDVLSDVLGVIFLYLFLCCFCVSLIFGVIWILCFFVGLWVLCWLFWFWCVACRFVVFVVCGWTTLGPFWLICPLCPFKRTPLLTYANNPKNLAFAEDNIYAMGLFFVLHSFTWNNARYFKVAAFYIKRQVLNSFNSFNKNFQQPN